MCFKMTPAQFGPVKRSISSGSEVMTTQDQTIWGI